MCALPRVHPPPRRLCLTPLAGLLSGWLLASCGAGGESATGGDPARDGSTARLETGTGKTPDRLVTGVELGPSAPGRALRPGGPPNGPRNTARADGAGSRRGPAGSITLVEGRTAVDLGQLVEGEVREHTFRLSNGGEGDLVIHRIQPNCSCTVTETRVLASDGTRKDYALGTPLAPGTRFELDCQVDSHGKRGHLASAVTLHSNDPSGLVTLQLNAEVTPLLTLRPPQLTFGRLTAAESRQASLEVTSEVLDAFSLELGDQPLHEAVAVALEPLDPGLDGRTGRWRVDVTVGPGLPEGALRQRIDLFTDVPAARTASGDPGADGGEGAAEAPIPVVGGGLTGPGGTRILTFFALGQVTPLVTASPPLVSFGVVRGGQGATRTVRIECLDEGFQLAQPALDVRGMQGGDFEYPELVSTGARPVEGVSAYDVDIHLAELPADLNATLRGVLVVQVGHPTKDAVEVPFSCIARGCPLSRRR